MNLLTILLFAAAYWIGHHDGVEETHLYYKPISNLKQSKGNQE